MPDTETVTPDQLGLVLMAMRSAAPIAFSALVDARARKTGNDFGVIRKLSSVQAFTGASYEAAVNRQILREGAVAPAFEAKERQWGERLSPCLVRKEDTGDLYLAVHVLRASRPTYLYRPTDKGGAWTPIAKDRIARFLPAEQSAAEAQGVEREVVYRNYRLDNLVSVSFGGKRYRVRRPAPVAPVSNDLHTQPAGPQEADRLARYRS